MRNDLLDDIHVINREIDSAVLKKRLLLMAVGCFILVLLTRLVFRIYFEPGKNWIIDFIGTAPLMSAFILNTAFAYYIYRYSEKKWSIYNYSISLFEFWGVMTVFRVIVYIMFGALLLVMLDVDLGSSALQTFYKELFWVDVIPTITDFILVFYFFNPIPKMKKQK